MAARKTPSKGGKPDKLMRDALALELHREVERDVDGVRQKIKRLRLVASALVDKAIEGDTAAIREINDRMDGKVPQAVTGEDGGPVIIERIERIIVDSPQDRDREGISPAT